jgi:HK97 family phage portal protein
VAFFRSLIEKREFSLARWTKWLDTLEAGADTATGISVSDETALTLSVVRSCVMVKAQDVAKVPLPIYRRLGRNGEDGREEARGYPLWRIFRVQANPYMTAFQFRQTQQKHLNVTGNAYALIDRDEQGNVTALWPRHPRRMAAEETDGRLVWVYTPSQGPRKTYEGWEVFHLGGLSDDGIVGMSPVEQYREGIALGLAYQQHAGYSFKNAVRPSLLAKTAAGPDKAKELGDALAKQYAGLSKSGGILVGYGGMEFVPWGFSNKDAEFILSRNFSVTDACRIWRMPPHKVMDYSQSAYANITAAELGYVNDTLRPEQENWEQEIARQLMTEEDREVYYAEHNNFDLLKGTPVERAQVETLYVRGGVSKINEVRKSHNWPPVPGGDECRTQMQMVPLTGNPQNQQAGAQQEGA